MCLLIRRGRLFRNLSTQTSQTQSSNVGSITINLKMGLWRYCYEFVVNGLSTTDGFACTTIDAACEFEIAGTKSKLSDWCVLLAVGLS